MRPILAAISLDFKSRLGHLAPFVRKLLKSRFLFTMQLGILLAVLASIMISENAPPEPVGELAPRLFLVFGASLCVVALGGHR